MDFDEIISIITSANGAQRVVKCVTAIEADATGRRESCVIHLLAIVAEDSDGVLASPEWAMIASSN